MSKYLLLLALLLTGCGAKPCDTRAEDCAQFMAGFRLFDDMAHHVPKGMEVNYMQMRAYCNLILGKREKTLDDLLREVP